MKNVNLEVDLLAGLLEELAMKVLGLYKVCVVASLDSMKSRSSLEETLGFSGSEELAIISTIEAGPESVAVWPAVG